MPRAPRRERADPTGGGVAGVCSRAVNQRPARGPSSRGRAHGGHGGAAWCQGECQPRDSEETRWGVPKSREGKRFAQEHRPGEAGRGGWPAQRPASLCGMGLSRLGFCEAQVNGRASPRPGPLGAPGTRGPGWGVGAALTGSWPERLCSWPASLCQGESGELDLGGRGADKPREALPG